MCNLGWRYANGQGVAHDYAKAREWYEKAADKGNTTAMCNLGGLYANGHGVGKMQLARTLAVPTVYWVWPIAQPSQ